MFTDCSDVSEEQLAGIFSDVGPVAGVECVYLTNVLTLLESSLIPKLEDRKVTRLCSITVCSSW